MDQKVGFIKIHAKSFIKVDNKEQVVPGIVLIRGPAVAILIKLIYDGEEYALLTSQARVASGKSSFLEIPAGMLDDKKNFAGVAATEIKEETGITIEEKDLVLLGEKYYPSVGGSDEHITFYYLEKNIDTSEFEEMKTKIYGETDEGEHIKVKFVKFKDLWKETHDMKALSALTLYENILK